MNNTVTAVESHSPIWLAQASQVELDRSAQPPKELTVENLRRRGIDILKVSWGQGTAASRTWLQMLGLGRKSSGIGLPGKIAFIDRQIRIYDLAAKGKNQNEVAINFSDVAAVEFLAGTSASKSGIRIDFKDRSMIVGAGLSKDSLHWLRDRILLETAGLVWKPLFNVGKRTTRQTTNPDDQLYTHWKSGPNRLVSLFLEHAPGHVQSLETAMAKRDLATVRQNAHWLKSSSAAVGATLLSELFQRLEIDIDIKSDTEVNTLVTHISAEFRKVSGALSRVMAAQPVSAPSSSLGSNDRTASAAEGPLSGVKVLLVEDSLVNQEVALDCLHETGCEVTLANDGGEAVARYSEQQFDIVLMDCQMSGMDGFRATRIIRDLEFKTGRPKTPIIALTAHALKGDREICIGAGMSDYMSKPFVAEVLLAKIEHWLKAGKEQDATEPSASTGTEAADEPAASRPPEQSAA